MLAHNLLRVKKVQIVDSHCHLDNPTLVNNIEAILARAAVMGVTKVQTICTQLKDFPKILSIAQQYHAVYCSVGVHPMHAHKEETCSTEHLIELSKHPKVISLGETGLDYYYSQEHIDVQHQLFSEHIEAAQVTGLPLVIHARDADKPIVEMLQSHFKHRPFTAVIHCFTASNWLAHACLEMGFYISAAGIITFKNAGDVRSTFMQMPLDRILVETDSPYLAPIPHRGKPCEPAFTYNTLEYLADMRGVSITYMAKQTTENFHRLFTKAA